MAFLAIFLEVLYDLKKKLNIAIEKKNNINI